MPGLAIRVRNPAGPHLAPISSSGGSSVMSAASSVRSTFVSTGSRRLPKPARCTQASGERGSERARLGLVEEPAERVRVEAGHEPPAHVEGDCVRPRRPVGEQEPLVVEPATAMRAVKRSERWRLRVPS